MSKKTLKVLTVLATILGVLCIYTFAFATEPGTYTGTDTSSFDSIGNRIIGALKAIGTILSVAVIVVLGIKYMMGSAEEKAEYKKTMIPYFIGAILVFAAPQVAGVIYNFANQKN